MQIGEIIRKYRKEQNMTQEEMASRLGVTAPAVNKWEKGNAYPDIMLLAPIARLLGISPDVLLAFQEELTEEEINQLVQELDNRLKQGVYEEAFAWGKAQIEVYPNCYKLIWQFAVILEAQRLMQEVPDAEQYDSQIMGWCERLLESNEEAIRLHGADSLFAYYMRIEEYDKAEKCLSYYSDQNPERKRKLADLLSKTDRREEAYKTYEELLFSGYQMLSMVFNNIYVMALQDGNMGKARKMVEKHQDLARLFEMGVYHEVSCGLELAAVEQDADKVVEIVQKMLESVKDITAFTGSELYEHMNMRKTDEKFAETLRKDLLEGMRNDEAFGFMKEDERWQRLIGGE